MYNTNNQQNHHILESFSYPIQYSNSPFTISIIHGTDGVEDHGYYKTFSVILLNDKSIYKLYNQNFDRAEFYMIGIGY